MILELTVTRRGHRSTETQDVIMIERVSGIGPLEMPTSLGYPLWDWPRSDWYLHGEKIPRPPYAC